MCILSEGRQKGVHLRNVSLVHIRDQQLTVQVTGDDTALVTIAYDVILFDDELKRSWKETVYLLGGALSQTGFGWTGYYGPIRFLPTDKAIKPNNTYVQSILHMEHSFRVPRYPAGPFTTTKFTGHIEVWPEPRMHDIKDTNEGVLPARYNPSSALLEVGRMARRVRRLLGI